MDKQIVAYIYNGMSFIHKKEWSIAICPNIYIPQKYYAERKKPDAIGNITWFHWYEISKIGKSIGTRCSLGVARGRGGGNREELFPAYRLSFWGD